MTVEERVPARSRRFLPAAVSIVCGGASLAVSWQRWINPFVDGGRELNVPARVAAGGTTVSGRRLLLRAAPVVAFPENGFFPFVTGARNPLRQEQILPGTLTDAGEREIVARIDAARPVVLVINRTTREFGKAGFGRDYAESLWKTIETSHRFRFSTIADSGASPVGAGPFFIHGYLPAGAR